MGVGGILGWAGALAFASSAGAAVLPFTGTMTLDINGVVDLGWSGSGSATVNGSGAGLALASLTLPAGAFATSALTTSLTSPAAFPIRGLQLTAANGAGAFARTGMGRLAGTMPYSGAAKVCLFGACSAAPPVNLQVPLSVVGLGGMAHAAGALSITVVGAPWTTGTAVIALPYTPYLTTRKGDARGPDGLPGSTAQPGGTLRLVTPVLISTNLNADIPIIPAWVTLSIEFVPEPSTLLLAFGGLALLGVRARRAR
ncbi:MAG: hypothetical protein DCC71_18325 [Proteobacteria bacterium]|nr:MAG: hypothetical protein DCC71_18325 [Pseudomonadota bacterium]